MYKYQEKLKQKENTESLNSSLKVIRYRQLKNLDNDNNKYSQEMRAEVVQRLKERENEYKYNNIPLQLKKQAGANSENSLENVRTMYRVGKIAQLQAVKTTDSMNKYINSMQNTNMENELGEVIQKKEENKTGIPDNLKAGIESLSGFSMDDVRVYYNSDKPEQLGALAYTQGTEVHVGTGQEKYLGHELGHVVQQKQGRVRSTTQMKRVNINDDKGLEKEADVIASKVLQLKENIVGDRLLHKSNSNNFCCIQRAGIPVKTVNWMGTVVRKKVENGLDEKAEYTYRWNLDVDFGSIINYKGEKWVKVMQWEGEYYVAKSSLKLTFTDLKMHAYDSFNICFDFVGERLRKFYNLNDEISVNQETLPKKNEVLEWKEESEVGDVVIFYKNSDKPTHIMILNRKGPNNTCKMIGVNCGSSFIDKFPPDNLENALIGREALQYDSTGIQKLNMEVKYISPDVLVRYLTEKHKKNSWCTIL